MTLSAPALAAYGRILKTYEDICALRAMESRLHRDMQTTMAPGSAGEHDWAMARLNSIVHEKSVDPALGKDIECVMAEAASLDDVARTNVIEMRRTYLLASCLPADLVTEMARATAAGERMHTEHMPQGNWAAVEDLFTRMLDMQRRAAAAYRAAFDFESDYDALLDLYSPGWTSADFDAFFDDLEPFLRGLLRDAEAKQKIEAAPLPIAQVFNDAAQEAICRQMVADLGFDTTRGVLYFIRNHPTADGPRDDVRLSGRPDSENVLAPIYDILHETGHALYKQNMSATLKHAPAGQNMGMDVHESQALLHEFVLGKSPAFAQYLSALLKRHAENPDDPALDAANIHAINTQVKTTLTRLSMQTGEVTYPLHIILRYRLEKEMIEGRLEPRDLPRAWNDLSEKMFGRKPATPEETCLQDVHWLIGYWGYFPSYAMGLAMGAQLYAAAKEKDPRMEEKIAQGDFSTLEKFLTEKIHVPGSLYDAKTLVRKATGKDVSAAALKAHLQRRYLP